MRRAFSLVSTADRGLLTYAAASVIYRFQRWLESVLDQKGGTKPNFSAMICSLVRIDDIIFRTEELS